MAREAAKTKHKSIYGVHPGVAMVQKAIQDLPARTGRSLEQWIKFIKKSGPKTETDRREWLKKEHGLGPTTLDGSPRERRAKAKTATPRLTFEPLKGTLKKCSRAQRKHCARSMTLCSSWDLVSART